MVLALEEEKGITLHRAISRRTSYGQGEKTGVMSAAVIREEKAKMHKTWCMTLYEKLFEGGSKNKKPKSFYRSMITK